ncbi:TRAP transporter small permease [Alkalicoccobacillus murimartini]|uniref:TRAP-type C4-dicarboxylate transport system permease small subunit n=1 Tax=Alkalicoccobacillus murimartini TaxID=171685 RepID=A0ABT9YH43_9BACI|nr:TRAP transporter small permease [Alkalicoccobacillus murimartini]MDQ0207188.1 TRAP-type C4-dicarboxylate transport system permease small subunit [Alkalicoccobacillus murimartini]
MKRLINNIDDFLSAVALAGIILLISLNVFFRFVLNNPITWTEEISLALFIWLVFVGLSSAMKTNSHVGIDYFVRKLPERWRFRLQVFRLVFIFALTLVVFVYWGAAFAIHGVAKVTPVLGVSYTFITLAVPVGSVLVLYHLIRVFIRKDRDYVNQERGIE